MSCKAILYFVFVVAFDKVNVQQPECDETIRSDLLEGNIGENSQLPWLGVLRVHSHDDNNLTIGLTGLVLIRPKYGIVNADDVANIPQGVLLRESKAMFILKKQETWSCGVKSLILHPEYDYATYNTIALVELEFEDNDDLIPICQPDNNYNTSNQLYAVGFVDDNMLLEKVVHKIQYLKQELCEDFFNRIGFQYKNMLYKPTYYYCGFAHNNKKHCVWDNGMVLISNSTGVWVLIGFGIKGPGCSAPSRFIQIIPYLPWIDSATDQINVF